MTGNGHSSPRQRAERLAGHRARVEAVLPHLPVTGWRAGEELVDRFGHVVGSGEEAFEFDVAGRARRVGEHRGPAANDRDRTGVGQAGCGQLHQRLAADHHDGVVERHIALVLPGDGVPGQARRGQVQDDRVAAGGQGVSSRNCWSQDAAHGLGLSR